MNGNTHLYNVRDGNYNFTAFILFRIIIKSDINLWNIHIYMLFDMKIEVNGLKDLISCDDNYF